MALGSLLVSLVLIGLGGALAVAGRDLYHLAITIMGFLMGFIPALLGLSPQAAHVWYTEGILEFLFTGGVSLLIAIIVGTIVAHLVWAAYILTIAFPGLLAGGMVGSVLGVGLGSPELSIILVLAFAMVGGWLAVMIHELLLVPLTALLGGVLIAFGLGLQRIGDLPIVRQPDRLLNEPAAVIGETLAVGELFAIVVLLVFVLGTGIQFASGGAAEAE